MWKHNVNNYFDRSLRQYYTSLEVGPRYGAYGQARKAMRRNPRTGDE